MTAGIVGIAAGVAALVVYGMTLCPTVYVEGSGELIGAAYRLGTAHPTGYPLFCLSSRLIALALPWVSPAMAINVASALFAAVCCGALAGLLYGRGVRPVVALATALALAFSRTFWSQAVIAEVYGLALLLVVLVLAQALRAGESKEPRQVLLLGWLMGLGLTAHLMQVLVWPGVVAVLAWRWPVLWRRPLLLAQGLLAALGGYSLVAYLPLRNGRGAGFHWGPLGDLTALWQHLSGALYRSSFFSLPSEGMLLNAQRWLEQAAGEFHFVLVPLVVWGAWAAWRRDRSVFVLVGGAITCNLIAALNYHRDPNGLPVFYLLSIVGLAVWLGMGLDALASRVRPLVSVPLAALVVALVLTAHYEESDRSENWVADRYGRDILADLPEGAILITEGDDAAFVLDYLLRIEGLRPDVTLYNRMGRGTDILAWSEHALTPLRREQLRWRREAALARGERPLFYLVPRRAPISGWVFVPAGLVYRLQAPGDSTEAAPQIEMGNALVADFFRDSWVRKIQSNYYFMAGEERLWAGDRAGAMAAYEQAAALAFDSRTMRFNVALKLFEIGELDRAMSHAADAAAIDPWQPTPYRLMAHIEREQGRYDEARRWRKKAGELQRVP
ncbi:MAG: DUF2723 domain-containing protein [Gemmatimonadetes bacterium]|nr:DUF2723 domain-containing protein [Gemmatimonadota bacterium]MYB70173.1 DUF2723 domain-containing protein [Gemmatimonadota bacterium]